MRDPNGQQRESVEHRTPVELELDAEMIKDLEPLSNDLGDVRGGSMGLSRINVGLPDERQ